MYNLNTVFVFMAAEGKAIIFYRCNLFFFLISSAQMKDQLWDLNQTWPVCQKWFRFTNAPKIWRPFLQIRGAKKHHFSATSALSKAYLRNETSHRQTKTLISIYNVPYMLTYSL